MITGQAICLQLWLERVSSTRQIADKIETVFIYRKTVKTKRLLTSSLESKNNEQFGASAFVVWRLIVICYILISEGLDRSTSIYYSEATNFRFFLPKLMIPASSFTSERKMYLLASKHTEKTFSKLDMNTQNAV